jgi:hypothetical protein
MREVLDLHRRLSGSLIEPFWSPAREFPGGSYVINDFNFERRGSWA